MDTETGVIRTVLIADDDVKRRDENGRSLGELGFRVVAAGVGPETIDLARGPNIALAIVSLTDGSGLSLLQQLSDSQLQHVLVIAIHCAPQNKLKAEQSGRISIFIDAYQPRTLANAAHALTNSGLSEPHREFPAPCPQCGQRTGSARSVSTNHAGAAYVVLQCDECGQEWRVLRQLDSPGAPGDP